MVGGLRGLGISTCIYKLAPKFHRVQNYQAVEITVFLQLSLII